MGAGKGRRHGPSNEAIERRRGLMRVDFTISQRQRSRSIHQADENGGGRFWIKRRVDLPPSLSLLQQLRHHLAHTPTMRMKIFGYPLATRTFRQQFEQ